jgi:uncharacterized protein (DUF2141 family)
MTDWRLPASAATAIALVLGGGAAAQSAPAVDLRVIVPNVAGSGSVVILLYNDPAAWTAEGRAFRTVVTPVKNGMAEAQFKASPGRYAVAAFQDRNGDGQLNLLPFRWPAEKVGYSGGVRPLIGRPSWDKADFGLEEGARTTQVVRLK